MPLKGWGYTGPEVNGISNLVAVGPDNVWAFYPGEGGPGKHSVGRLYLISGYISDRVMADGHQVLVAYSGRVRDLCAAIS